MIDVLLEGIDKQYPGSNVEAVRNFSLTVERGELVCLLGPSGCGKTTTLKMIAGLLEPDRGRILFDREDVTRIPAEHRDSVMVFQNHLLFPFLSVADNVGFGLKMKGLSRTEIRRRVTPMLERMQLAGYEDRRPSQLSGGQRQRVALARALVLEPKVLLLDEPLSNLDASLRDEMRELILSIKNELDLTIIFVTHDQEEAVLLADRIAVMFDGELQQYGRSDELYRAPATLKIARFFGNNNSLPGYYRSGSVKTSVGTLCVTWRPGMPETDGQVSLLVRPEEITLSHPRPAMGPTHSGARSNASAPGESSRADGRESLNGAGFSAGTDGSETGTNRIEVVVLRHVYMGTHRRYIIDVAGRHWTVLDRSRSAPFSEGERAIATIPGDATWLIPE